GEIQDLVRSQHENVERIVLGLNDPERADLPRRGGPSRRHQNTTPLATSSVKSALKRACSHDRPEFLSNRSSFVADVGPPVMCSRMKERTSSSTSFMPAGLRPVSAGAA